jgi:hypothetical protein
MKRPAPWQTRRIATAKALRELPKCEYPGCGKRGMGYARARVRVGTEWGWAMLWLCAAEAQRAQRERT